MEGGGIRWQTVGMADSIVLLLVALDSRRLRAGTNTSASFRHDAIKKKESYMNRILKSIRNELATRLPGLRV